MFGMLGDVGAEAEDAARLPGDIAMIFAKTVMCTILTVHCVTVVSAC